MGPGPIGHSGLLRQINEVAVLSVLRRRALASRTEVARATGLSLPTVSAVATRLLALGLLEEREIGESTGGRRPVLLAIRPSGAHVAGIKLTETAAHGVLVDLAGSIVATATRATTQTTPRAVVRACAEVVDRLSAQGDGRAVLALGVGVAGAVDWVSGVVRHATYQQWRDVPLRDLLRDELEIPVVVDNDVNSLVTSEQLFGAGQDTDDFAVITVGRGIGLGLVLQGHAYRGSVGGAGELGHTKVADGPDCVCGGSGCLEAVTSDRAVATQVSEQLGRSLEVSDVVALARGGNEVARRAFELRGRVLGRAAGNLVNLLNPRTLVLAGEGMNAAELFLPAFRTALDEAVFDGLIEGLNVVVHPWKDEAWARGAACLVLNELFVPNVASGATPLALLPTDLVG